MSYPYYPPQTQTVDGVLYHLDKWYYSNDYDIVKAEYYIDLDYEKTAYDARIYRTFNVN